MKRVSSLSASLVAILWSTQCISEVDFPCDTDQGVAVFFGNGILTGEEQARLALVKIESQLRTHLSTRDQRKFSFDLAYNHTHEMSDILESVQQSVTENVEDCLRAIYGLVQPSESLRELVADTYALFNQEAIVSDNDLTDHLVTYREVINDKKKIVIGLYHSQGNFLGNAAWRILYQNPLTEHLAWNSFSIVSVANPSSVVEGGGPYTTRGDDRIINAVRRATAIAHLDPTLPGNIRGDVATSDPWIHRISETYLIEGSMADVKILNDLTDRIDSTERPPYTPPASCNPPPEPPLHPMCSDGIDNDGDGKTDWNGGPDDNGDGLPDGIPDPGCTGPTDTNEFNILIIRG